MGLWNVGMVLGRDPLNQGGVETLSSWLSLLYSSVDGFCHVESFILRSQIEVKFQEIRGSIEMLRNGTKIHSVFITNYHGEAVSYMTTVGGRYDWLMVLLSTPHLQLNSKFICKELLTGKMRRDSYQLLKGETLCT